MKSNTIITWESPVFGPSGYAFAARGYILGLSDLGVKICCKPIWGDCKIEILDSNIRTDDFVDVVMEGQVRLIRLLSPIDSTTVKKLAKLTYNPIGGVYVIHHPPSNLEGRNFFKEFKEKNPAMRAYIGYTTFETETIPQEWVEICNSMDEIWVPSNFNKDGFVKAGVNEDKIFVIPHGLEPEYYNPDKTSPLVIGEERGFNFLSIFEWTYRKGWDILIRAYLEEFSEDEDVRLIIRSYQGGGVIGKNVLPIPEQMINYIRGIGFDPDKIPRIDFIDNMIPAELMPSLYKMADAFILPTRGEGWGIPFAESMLMEVPVIATKWGGHLDFMNDDNSFLIEIEDIVPVGAPQIRDNPLYRNQRWAEPSVEDTKRLMRYVFENREDAKLKGKKARQYIIDNFTTKHAALKIRDRINDIDDRKCYRRKTLNRRKKTDLNILFQARSNIFTQPGGDTEVMVEIKKQLEKMGNKVDICTHTNVNLCEYDLIHIFNFETSFAINAALQKKPFVVTPMYEDFDRYLLKSFKVVNLFKEYIDNYDSDKFERKLKLLNESTLSFYKGWYSFITSNADAILVSGAEEKRILQRDYNYIKNIEIVKLGFNRPEGTEIIKKDLFIEKYGVDDFVLCVGRLETRKNQLMLLYALKDVNIPIVFINSKTPQPEYEDICRRFRRKGKTLFTGRVSKELLYSAYKAARVHALPSWYELPGLVSLEAAWFGCNVVTSEWGTIRDYLGDYPYYCNPDDPQSIRDAVLMAYSKKNANPYKLISQNTWEQEAVKIREIYDNIISECMTTKGQKRLRAKVERAKKEDEILQKKEMLFKICDKNPSKVYYLAKQFINNLQDPYSFFILGKAALLLMKYNEAEYNLKQCIRLNPFFEYKAYFYLYLTLMKQKKYNEAIEILQNLIEINPFLNEETKNLVYRYIDDCYTILEKSNRPIINTHNTYKNAKYKC